jgi:hypothetical protein
MSTFEFHIDQKTVRCIWSVKRKETIWRRNYARVEADTEEEAILKMKLLAHSDDYDIDVHNNELVLETSEDMTYYDNLNNPTREVYYKDNMIEDNTPLDIKRNKKINQIINEKD